MTAQDPRVKKIIDEIFDPHISEPPNGWHPDLPSPTQKSLIDIATLISNDDREEDFQQFFSNNPTFLFKEVPAYGDANAGIITKLPIGNSFVSDFAVFVYGQGGCKITLVEIEKPSDELFTKRLTPAKKLNNAIGQVTEWNEWITLNKQTFVRDSIDILKKAPLMTSPNIKGSFKTQDGEFLESGWNAFHGFSEYCIISSLIIIGRWSQLNGEEKKRLIFLNNPQNSPNRQIRTYDQVIRRCFGPEVD